MILIWKGCKRKLVLRTLAKPKELPNKLKIWKIRKKYHYSEVNVPTTSFIGAGSKRAIFPELIGFVPFVLTGKEENKIAVTIPVIEGSSVSFSFKGAQTLISKIVIPPTIENFDEFFTPLKLPLDPLVLEFETNLGVEVHQSDKNCKRVVTKNFLLAILDSKLPVNF